MSGHDAFSTSSDFFSFPGLRSRAARDVREQFPHLPFEEASAVERYAKALVANLAEGKAAPKPPSPLSAECADEVREAMRKRLLAHYDLLRAQAEQFETSIVEQLS